jgi:hypothetical protein
VLESFTENTVVKIADLQRELATVRKEAARQTITAADAISRRLGWVERG